MRYLHTMVRVRDLDASLRFYLRRPRPARNAPQGKRAGRYTLVFLAAPDSPEARDRAHLQLGSDSEDYGGGAQFRPPRLSRRQHLRDLRAPAEDGRDDQPPAARRTHGVRALARSHLDRAAAGRPSAAAGAVGVDAEHRRVVIR